MYTTSPALVPRLVLVSRDIVMLSLMVSKRSSISDPPKIQVVDVMCSLQPSWRSKETAAIPLLGLDVVGLVRMSK